MPTRPPALRLVLCAALTLVLLTASTALGPQALPWTEILAGQDNPIFWRMRLPRTLLAAAAGAGLAVSGVLLQILFRNPLAEPYTLGIASGASLGAAMTFWLGANWVWLGISALTVSAFGGSLAAIGFVYLLSRLQTGRDMTRLLLAGICFAYLCSAGVMLVTFLAGKPVTNDLVIWMMGALWQMQPYAAAQIALLLLPALLYGIVAHRALDLLLMGDDLAASRGVAVARVVWTCFGLVGLLTAMIVSNCGPIAFVGLMAPHMARAIFGTRALSLLIGSTLIGAAFLALCDGAARSFRYEVPVGVVTNIAGAIFFLYLLASRPRA